MRDAGGRSPDRGAAATPLDLPVRRTEPRVGRQETDRALQELAEPAMSAPVTLTVDGRRIPVGPSLLSKHLTLKDDDGQGRLNPVLDAKALPADPALAGPLRQAGPGPVEARLRMDGAGRASVAEEGRAGGAVPAVATTVFNATFFAGVEAVEYGAHSFHIERYPEGRGATVAWGSLDLRFANDSGKALYIQAEATDTSVTITFLGTRKYEEVRAVQGPRTNVQPPATRKGSGPKCEPRSPLEDFDAAVDRVFVQGGKEVKRETMKTRYTPRDTVTCGA
ncbi:hypothetical protein BGK67_04385 [Streptomyces subrutilus]|uniref:Uncharacterized protein n=1 Tax=Streptomyces subrutilus TaxID=36818 RepID=A0A1E5Q111_9ACTN|nr:hypothetical protein BGK67_04385 [Streptomyces subrutilus]